MGGHALRGMVTAWLGLIVLQAVGSTKGSGRVAGLFADVDRLVKRALDPSIPAIPDRRTGAASTGAASSGGWAPDAGAPFHPALSGSTIAGAHPGAQINPSTGAVVGFGY